MGNNKKSIFLIDFDITISKKDSTDVLLETHQPEFKQELRKRYRAGEYSIREFIKYGLGSLNITKEQYIQTLQENVTIDETFIDFVKSGAEFKIVSAGARLNVQGTLSKYGINLPDSEVISNDLKFSGTDKNQITVENPFLDKEGYYGVDKKEAVENYKKQGYTTYFVGDGPSDYKALEVADFGFVRKGTRAVKFCKENQIYFKEFDNFDEILAESDGIMVARGDLGVEIPAEEVPFMQKMMIRKCNEAGKPVITATQMLDSMQKNPRPTRAEAGDVANAILDGTDAVMLSGESAAGDYPVEAVRTMANICVRTEQEIRVRDKFKLKAFDETDVAEAIGRSVAHTAKNLKVKTIVAATESGHTPKMISKFRPDATILGVTSSERQQRALALIWGVKPVIVDRAKSTDEMFEICMQAVRDHHNAQEGDLVIITAGVPLGIKGTTNMMKVARV